MSATWYPEGYHPQQQQYYYPPGPPPLSAATSNPNPQPWRGYQPQPAPRKSEKDGGIVSNSRGMPVASSRGMTSSSRTAPSAAAPSQAMHGPKTTRNSGHPKIDFVEGVNYFRIGETVRARRYYPLTNSYSDWIRGEVLRPIVRDGKNGSQCRSYLVSYMHPANAGPKEKEFSPYYSEITSLKVDPAPFTPYLRSSQLILAPIPDTDAPGTIKPVVYTQAMVLTSPDVHGAVRLRVLAGPNAKRELNNFSLNQAQPYTAESADMLRLKNFRVESDGTDRSI
ncbi:hypothetical protein DFH06DRAFT_1358231 [Mycena polygramma]|nr:hypothetical protein DFH06DRAFT_1358231 [Mycena polygramma]